MPSSGLGPAALSGPIYRSPLVPARAVGPAQATAERTWPGGGDGTGVQTEPVPSEVAAAFGELTGLDVTGIPVHRGPAVGQQARAYQARAFTRSGEIFLPDEAGPIGHADTRALLAHELTHAIQQRVLATPLPDETTPHGQELEGEAKHAEQWYRSANGVQRQPDGHAPAAAGTTVPGQAAPQITPSTGGPGPAGLSGTGHAAAPAGALAATPNGTAGGGRPELDELAKHSGPLVKLSGQRPADLDDPESLDELASKVYPRLRGMLRGELLVDRERAGLLADLS